VGMVTVASQKLAAAMIDASSISAALMPLP
jgi:hypothetical protein